MRMLPLSLLLALSACTTEPTVLDKGVDTSTVSEDTDSDSDSDTDTDTDTEPDADVDGDGYTARIDCEDENPAVNPGADELCNGIDDDCDGVVDPGTSVDAPTWYADLDFDGYGDDDSMMAACDPGPGWVAVGGDCDDSTNAVSPAATEVCNGIDDDCDGTIDTTGGAEIPTWYVDLDGDGFGDADYAVTDCEAPADFFVLNGEDCDDTADTVNPDAADSCGNAVDDNCDGSVDETCTADADGDGFDLLDGDCDDFDASTYPGAPEGTSTDVDNDCSGTASADPIAVAVNSGSTLTCNDVGLDGSGSYDLAGLPLTYEWELVAGPADSSRTTADIISTDDVAPVFAPDVAGTYSFDLVVDNGDVESVPDTLDIVVTTRPTNSAPETRAGADQAGSGISTCTVIAYTTDYTCDECDATTFTLSATGVTDADGDDLTYAWSITSGGTYGTLSASTGDSVVVTIAGAPATYGASADVEVDVELTTTDCMGASSSDSVTLTYTCTGA
jgi:hypothetical protein